MEDTICALSTAIPGAIAIIKVSGKDAINIVNKIFKPNNLDKASTHSIHYGKIYNKDEIIDEVLVMVMKGPKTYTKEDIVEINCHGSITTTSMILKILLNNGARIAEPGEFTKRAFLNGRIDLTEAESVNDLIMSKSKTAHDLAIKGISGKLKEQIITIRNKILSIMANIEVNIDYPEYDDIEIMTSDILLPKLKIINNELKILLQKSKNIQVIKNGVDIAIVGKPNVGKSSLLNALLQEEKAIVTNIEGTTRDIVEGSIELNSILINLYDTAGIRKTDNLVEQIGVEKSINLIDNANLIIFVVNNNEKISNEELKLLEKYKDKKVILFVNKNDLERRINFNNINFPIIYGNTIEIDGLNDLKKVIIKELELNNDMFNDLTYLSNARQLDLTEKAIGSIKKAINSLNNNITPDIASIDIKNAWDYLGEIIGQIYNDELLDELFSKFCIGK